MVAKFLSFSAISTAATLFDAFVILMFWTWFLVPLGVPEIGFWHAAGLDLALAIVLLISFPRSDVPFDHGKDIEWMIAKRIVAALALGFGFIISKLI